jgi:hypothetical protein
MGQYRKQQIFFFIRNSPLPLSKRGWGRFEMLYNILEEE